MRNVLLTNKAATYYAIVRQTTPPKKVGFLKNSKLKDSIVRVNSIGHRVAELVLCITKRYKLNIVQVYAPTTSYSEEDMNSFYNDVDEILGKPNHTTR